MKKVFPSLFLLLVTFISNSQITKKNWMVGGNGRLASKKETLNSSRKGKKQNKVAVLLPCFYFKNENV